jgi:hypothetical protein
LDLKLTFLTDGDQQAPQTVVRQTVWDDSNVGIALRGLTCGRLVGENSFAGEGDGISARNSESTTICPNGFVPRPDNATLTGGVFFFNPRNPYLAFT